MFKQTMFAAIAALILATGNGSANAMKFALCSLVPVDCHNPDPSRDDIPFVSPEHLARIDMNGDIVPGDAETFSRFYNQVSRQWRILGFRLNSSGGTVYDALRMGEIIHSAGPYTWTVIQPGDVCASACFWMFVAGRIRVMPPGARIGVHSPSYPTGAEATEGAVALARYGHKIGLPDSVVVKFISTPPNLITWLSRRDLVAMGVDLNAGGAE
jgi:hypothetical protein